MQDEAAINQSILELHEGAVAATQRLIKGAMADHVHTAMYYE